MHNSERVSHRLLITNWNEKWMTYPLLSHWRLRPNFALGGKVDDSLEWVASRRQRGEELPHFHTMIQHFVLIDTWKKTEPWEASKKLTRTDITQCSYDTSHPSNWDDFVTFNQALIETFFSVLSILSPLLTSDEDAFREKSTILASLTRSLWFILLGSETEVLQIIELW